MHKLWAEVTPRPRLAPEVREATISVAIEQMAQSQKDVKAKPRKFTMKWLFQVFGDLRHIHIARSGGYYYIEASRFDDLKARYDRRLDELRKSVESVETVKGVESEAAQ